MQPTDDAPWSDTLLDTETDDSDAHSIWCNCNECVEVIIEEMIEDRVPVR